MGREVIQYAVVGLPREWQALVGKKDGHWRTLRVRNNVPETWCGQHATPEAALAALRAQLGD